MAGPRPPRLAGGREQESATFEIVEVQARGHHVPARVVKAGIAMSSLAVVALVAVGLTSPPEDVPRSPLLSLPSAAVPRVVAADPTPVWTQLTSTAIPPGPFVLVGPTRDGGPWLVSVVVPQGWSEKWYESMIYKGDYELDDGPRVVAHQVTRVVTQVCRFEPADAVSLAEIDPTVDDFVAALANIPGLEVSGPTDDVVSSFPAKRVNLAFSQRYYDRCGGPEGRTLWENVDGARFSLLDGATTTIFAVDVDGLLMVIAGTQRGSPPAEAAELDAVLASVRVRPALPWSDDDGPMFGPLGPKETRILDVAGTRFSIRAPASVPGAWYREGQTSIDAELDGLDAEAIVYWAGYPFDPYAAPCFETAALPESASIDEIADAVAGARGTDLLAGPSDATVGGRPAKYTQVTVREDIGCDPGFFFTWIPFELGPAWTTSEVGDTISSWVVDLDGRVLFMAAEVREHTASGVALTDALRAELDREITEIIDSVQFE